MRQFFICSVGQPGKDYVEENLQRIISEKAFFMHEDTTQKGLFENINCEDILILKYNSNYIAYGESAGTKIVTDEYGWIYCSPVKEWNFFNKNNNKNGVNSYGVQWETIEGSGQMATVKGITREFGFLKIKEININNDLYHKLFSETKMGQMENLKKLIEYKKQIILQGPPGTGKTRKAKEIAKLIIGVSQKITPLQYVEDFIKNYQPTKESNNYDYTSQILLNDFKDNFDVEKIKVLSIDDYALGNGSVDSFCYWIERKLELSCKFSTGPAGTTVYGISYNKETGEIRKVDDSSAQTYMKDIRDMLLDLIEKKDYTKARGMKFRMSFILKILHSYFPEEYFPVLSKDHLKFFAKIFKVDTKNLDDVEINQKINREFNKIKINFSSSVSSGILMQNLYNKFKIKNEDYPQYIDIDEGVNVAGNYKIIQFHPSYTYEDFVRGITAETNDKGQIEYKVINKIIGEISSEAIRNPLEKFVLIIDEINRANLSSVLGELIYALEYRYKFKDTVENQKESEVESLYAIPVINSTIPDYTLKLPENLYIIGTMNTADRSVGHIDYAIRRRFSFVEILPEALIDNDEIYFNIEGFNTVAALFNCENVSNEFEIKDVQIGHSYFIAKKSEAKNESERDEIFKMKMKYEVVPILEEYVKDGILIKSFDGKPIKEYILTLKP